jgi:hypothetical protein
MVCSAVYADLYIVKIDIKINFPEYLLVTKMFMIISGISLNYEMSESLFPGIKKLNILSFREE